ncbi:MAG: tetratricopeptide repeat protein, partial [Boseongicola sp.]
MAQFIAARNTLVARVNSVARANTRWLAVSLVCVAFALPTSTASAQSGGQRPAYTFNHDSTAVPGLTPKKKSWYRKVGDSWSKGWNATTGAVKKVVPRKKSKPNKNDPVHLGGKQAVASADLHAGLAQMALAQGRNDRAVKHFQQAFKLDPNNLTAIRVYARYLQRQGKLAEAEQQIRRAIKLDPNSPGTWNNLGMCLAQQRKHAGAVQAMEKAIQMRPKKTLYRNNAAAVLVEMGQTDRAFNHLTQAHGGANAHYNVGCLLARTGRRVEAAAHFNR